MKHIIYNENLLEKALLVFLPTEDKKKTLIENIESQKGTVNGVNALLYIHRAVAYKMIIG